jgi:hypothetical protein
MCAHYYNRLNDDEDDSLPTEWECTACGRHRFDSGHHGRPLVHTLAVLFLLGTMCVAFLLAAYAAFPKYR